MQTRVAWIPLAVVALVACSDERALSPYVGTGQGTGAGNGAASSSSAGGSSPGTAGSGGSGPLTELPEEPACQRNVAFQAHGLSFVEPTPQRLAMRLNEMSFGYDSQGFLVALGAESTGSPRLLAGYGESQDGVYQIPSAVEPVSARVGPGGFESLVVQPSATLRVGQGQNTVDLELRNVTVKARTVGDCGEAWVSLSAVIPTSEQDLELTSDAGSDTVAALAGGSQDGQLGWQLQALFLTEAVSYDFTGWAP